MNQEALDLMRHLFGRGTAAVERAENATDEESVRYNAATAERVFPQAATVAAIVQAEALASIAESLEVVAAYLNHTGIGR